MTGAALVKFRADGRPYEGVIVERECLECNVRVYSSLNWSR